MSTGCEFYADALVELADGRLEAGRAEQVRAHMADCQECQETLEVIRAVRSAPAPVPKGLEARLTAAVLEAVGSGDGAAEAREWKAANRLRPLPVSGDGFRWRPWALPVAAAAAVLLWLGANQVLVGPDPSEGAAVEAALEYDPFGAWPGTDGEVAGEVVLSELTVAELEALLEEMQS